MGSRPSRDHSSQAHPDHGSDSEGLRFAVESSSTVTSSLFSSSTSSASPPSTPSSDETHSAGNFVIAVAAMVQALTELDAQQRRPDVPQLDALSVSFTYHLLPRNGGTVADSPEDPYPLQSCVICLIDFQEGDSVRMLPCLHRFHRECVDRWMTTQSCTCPYCRHDPRIIALQEPSGRGAP